MNILMSIEEIKKLKSRDLVPILCDVCGVKFFRKKHQLQAQLKNNVKFFRCNKKCYKKKGKFVKCNSCGKEIYKFPNQLNKFKKYYCSSKCSCIQSNKIRWKNHIPITNNIKCNICGFIRNYQSKNCPNCKKIKVNIKHKNTTVEQLKNKYVVKNNSSYWYSSEIRQLNRRWNKELLLLPCQKCGYKIHVELCHIKPINEFHKKSTLEEINKKENNLVLCPNHHYEFDKGILKLNDIPKRNGGGGDDGRS